MKNIKDLEKGVDPKPYKPDVDDNIVSEHVFNRITEMKNYRKQLGVEKDWKDADAEYIPGELSPNKGGRKILEADQTTGLRSKLVPVGDSSQDWRSQNSSPELLVKIQTALSIIIDKNPEAALTALQKKYEKTTDLAYSLWKRNWEITNSKEILKLFVFNLAKYGWAVGRSFPRLIKYNKQVLKQLDTENPENNVYDENELVWFNDLARQNLDPFKTWIDEMTQPYDIYSMNDCYYEIDYSYDAAAVEFSQYPNWKNVPKSARNMPEKDEPQLDEKLKERQDIVTIGFYENRLKDLYAIVIPTEKIVLYRSPLPNDDGMLSLWQTPWVLRDAKSPYGISLWTMIKQDKTLYDKMNNMSMDQLVLSIMKMAFYTGSASTLGDGKIKIVPGKFEQIMNGDVKWLEIPGPGKDSWEGLQHLKSKMDDASGITPTIEGQVTGKTLGEILHAKEAALKRLKVPLENIADAIEQDAYLSLSWMSQIYSTPEVQEFADVNDLMQYEKSNEIEHANLYQQFNPETNEPTNLLGTFMPQLSLHLEDSDGKLVESKESRFFQVGKDLKPGQLKWRGIFKILPKSILAPSVELEKQRKMEMFNIILPAIQSDPMGQLLSKAIKQIIKINEEDPQDWLPDTWLQEGQELFVQQPVMPGQVPGQPAQVPQPGQTMQGQTGIVPNQGAPTVVPGSQMPDLKQMTGGGFQQPNK